MRYRCQINSTFILIRNRPHRVDHNSWHNSYFLYMKFIQVGRKIHREYKISSCEWYYVREGKCWSLDCVKILHIYFILSNLMVTWIIENNVSFIWHIVFKFDSQKLHIEIFNIINIFYGIQMEHGARKVYQNKNFENEDFLLFSFFHFFNWGGIC